MDINFRCSKLIFIGVTTVYVQPRPLHVKTSFTCVLVSEIVFGGTLEDKGPNKSGRR